MDFYQIGEVALKLGLAILIGGLVGFERGNHNSPAGFRTHILVCLGTTIISLIQLEIAQKALTLVTTNPELAHVISIDYARLGAQAISGMGFLGAGTIIHSKGTIKGLTTAASLWVVGTLGLAVGMGFYVISLGGTICIFLVLVVLKKVQRKFLTNAGECELEIILRDDVDLKDCLDYINGVFIRNNIRVRSIENSDDAENNGYLYVIFAQASVSLTEAKNQLVLHDDIKKVKKL